MKGSLHSQKARENIKMESASILFKSFDGDADNK